MIDFSMDLFKNTWKIYDNEQNARDALNERFKREPKFQRMARLEGAASNAFKTQIQWCARWPSCGFPIRNLKLDEALLKGPTLLWSKTG